MKRRDPCCGNLGRALCLWGTHTGGGTLLNGQQPVADPGWRKGLVRGKGRGRKVQKNRSSSKKRAPLHCPSPHQWYRQELGVKHSENGGKGAGGREMLG